MNSYLDRWDSSGFVWVHNQSNEARYLAVCFQLKGDPDAEVYGVQIVEEVSYICQHSTTLNTLLSTSL
jgi:hypothetical protein